MPHPINRFQLLSSTIILLIIRSIDLLQTLILIVAPTDVRPHNFVIVLKLLYKILISRVSLTPPRLKFLMISYYQNLKKKFEKKNYN